MGAKLNAMMSMLESGMIERTDNIRVDISKDLYLTIVRYDNKVFFAEGSANYIIEIKFYNLIGIELYMLRFNELDAIRILDSINFFQYETSGGIGDSMLIAINPSNTTLNVPYMNFVWTSGLEEDLENPTDDYYDIRDIEFTVFQENMTNQFRSIIIKTNISENTLDEFVFGIYFIGLIDIVPALQRAGQNIDPILYRLS